VPRDPVQVNATLLHGWAGWRLRTGGAGRQQEDEPENPLVSTIAQRRRAMSRFAAAPSNKGTGHAGVGVMEPASPSESRSRKVQPRTRTWCPRGTCRKA
jgi:hypothetical protein